MDFRRPLNAITPTLDGDVLATLAGADAEFTGRQVHRVLGRGSERGVRNTLERLTRQGVVLSRRAGAAKLYRLNTDHLATPWVKGLAGMRVQLLDRLKTTVEQWPIQPAAAVLFGSVARGDASEESDLDLLIVRPADCPDESAQWEEQLSNLEQAATAWTGNDARILEYGETELSEGRASSDAMLSESTIDGIVFFGSLRRLTGPRPRRNTR